MTIAKPISAYFRHGMQLLEDKSMDGAKAARMVGRVIYLSPAMMELLLNGEEFDKVAKQIPCVVSR